MDLIAKLRFRLSVGKESISSIALALAIALLDAALAALAVASTGYPTAPES